MILFSGYQVCPKIPGSSILGHFARESVRLAYLQGSILINPEKFFFSYLLIKEKLIMQLLLKLYLWDQEWRHSYITA